VINGLKARFSLGSSRSTLIPTTRMEDRFSVVNFGSQKIAKLMNDNMYLSPTKEIIFLSMSPIEYV
jgi:hypothetical protein